MSVYATSWAKKQRTGDSTMKHVLAAIADYADEDGVCWPSQERIAFDTELSERSIRRALKALEDGKFISRRKRMVRSTGLRQTDIITLLMPRPDNLSGGENPTLSTGHTGQSYRPQCPPNHHRNHHSNLSHGAEVSGRGSRTGARQNRRTGKSVLSSEEIGF